MTAALGSATAFFSGTVLTDAVSRPPKDALDLALIAVGAFATVFLGAHTVNFARDTLGNWRAVEKELAEIKTQSQPPTEMPLPPGAVRLDAESFIPLFQ